MGGLLFLLAPLVASALAHDAVAGAFSLLIVGSAAIGFVDDYAAIRRGRNRGLRARTKFLATALVGAVFLGILAQLPGVNRDVLFIGPLPTWLWFVLSLAVVLATTHAVNLTDGLDGLAAGTIVPPLIVLAFIALRQGSGDVAMVTVAMLGAVLGFLVYNRHPAKMFMGDTGSLALGGALAGAAILTGAQLLLVLIGGVFVAETLSVILQVTSYKTTKKRIFRMSPLHHHFELGGWPETTVTARFWLASLVLGLIGFALVVRA
jgi:phospho-N-acetylmuramoyl-pentapeptide-transferase